MMDRPATLLATAFVVLLALSTFPTESDAQVRRWLMPDTIKPTGSLYNVDDDEFIVGALLLHWLNDEPGDTVGVLWDFARFMKVSDWVWSPMFDLGSEEKRRRQLDTLMLRAQPNERLTVTVDPIEKIGGFGVGGGGQMLEVFLFDSVQSPYIRWELLGVDTSKGELRANDFYDNTTALKFDWPWTNKFPHERFYSDSTEAGLVAEHLAIGYDPIVDTGWTGHLSMTEPFKRQTSFLENLYAGVSGSRDLSVALKGHLSETLDPNVADSDTIFIIELVHVIPQGRYYLDRQLDSIGCTDTSENADPLRKDSNCTGVDWVYRVYRADSYTERSIDSFAVTRADLIAGPEDRAKYRDISFTTDLRYRRGDDTLTGPMPDGFLSRDAGGSPVVDVKLYWTGKEEPSVRSIMLRNPTAELMYGASQASVDFRADVMEAAHRMIHGLLPGSSVIDSSSTPKASLLRFDASHESFEYGYGSYRAILRFLTDSLVYNSGADSIPSGVINHFPRLQHHALHVGELKATAIEYGYWDFGYDGRYAALPAGRNVLPYSQKTYFYKSSGELDSATIYLVPSIAEHNGGRDDSLIGPPLLRLTVDSIEMYTESVQRGFYGFYTSGPEEWGKEFGGRTVPELAAAARAAATYGVPLHGINGGFVTVWYDTVDVVTEEYQDTIKAHDGTDSLILDRLRWVSGDFVLRVPHQPEVSELRAEANLLLAYGGDAMQFYGMATDTNILGDHYMLVDDGPNGADTLTWGSEPSFGYTGPLFTDAVAGTYDDVVTLQVQNHAFSVVREGDTTFMKQGKYKVSYPGFWGGWKSRPKGVQDLAVRTRAIGAEMRKRRLEWRTSYSVHNQAIKPNSSDTSSDFPGTRPLPSDEIVTHVQTRHPVTGVVDSAWATYVELGLFYTKTDTGSNPDPMLDTHAIFVVNRRTFERPNDIPDTSSRLALMDALTENRTIRMTMNLPHPDSTQYCFLRIREILPETDTLRLLGLRTGLDTVVRGDSAVELTLRPGGGALLEVTYAPPDTSIIDGHLHWNNQRKMIYFDDDRYHAAYLRNDSVLHRRSMRMAPNPGSILWEPDETVVSIGPQRTTTQNWTPSITGSVHNGDTVVTIVWTCHSDSSGVRDVVLHDLLLNGGGQPVQQSIRHIDYHSGTDSTQVGDAVVAAMHGGDVIAWGDSQLGVVSRVRLRSAPGVPTVLSNRALVSQPYHDTVNNRVGKWPALPSFAHRASSDSNVAIVWNQPIGTGVNARIYYQRVLQNPIVGTVPGIALLNFTPVSWNPSPIGRPSIDQTQDLWHRLQEGITFSQDRGATTSDLIWYRSMWTSVNAGPDGDTINATQAWSTASLEGPNGGGGFTFDTYPTASSLNDYMVLADTSGYAHFAIAWVDRWAHYYSGELYTYQANMQYAMDTFRLGWPQVYTFGGDDPQGTASPLAQRTRHAVLYETEIDGSDVMRTTRQFFAKSRPTGYVAQGRRTIVPIDLNSSTYFELLVHDPWIADDAGGTALSWAPRDPSKKTDSVHQVEELMRSVYFSAGDSTAVGLELQAFFHGDSAEAPTARISLIAELVDSTNGSVIKQLDSIAVTAAADSHNVVLAPEYDLLSSTYYIRVRLDTADLDVAPSEANQEIFHVSEYASLVPDPPAAKFARRLGPSSGNGLRISAQPNPADDRVEIRFSIHEAVNVSVVLIDGLGREVSRPVASVEYASGRYSVEFGTDNLPSGSYIVELRAGKERATTRLVVR